MNKLLSLLLITGVCHTGLALAQEDKPLSEDVKEQVQQTQMLKDKIQKQRQEAGASANREMRVVWEDVEAVLEVKSTCFKKEEEIEVRLCINEALKKLADGGNFAAQDAIAKSYFAVHKNYEMALSWYKKALENPKTPLEFKQFILDDIQKIEGLIKDNDKKGTDSNSISQTLKEQVAFVLNEQQNIEKEIKKAERTRDKESLEMLTELEVVFNSQKPCFDLKEEYDIQLCMMRQIKALADKNNFFAQHQLGNIYENGSQNKAMAIKWYNAALKNPKLPKSYKSQVESDLSRVKSKTN